MEDKQLREAFAQNLNKYLELRGKKQADMARHMNVSTATAAKWCTGQTMPRIDKIQSLCNWLLIEKSDLLGTHAFEPYPLPARIIAYAEKLGKLNEAGRAYIDQQIDFALQQDSLSALGIA